MLNVVLLCYYFVLVFLFFFNNKNDHTKKEFVEIQNRYSKPPVVNVTLLITFDVLDHIYSTVLEVQAYVP